MGRREEESWRVYIYIEGRESRVEVKVKAICMYVCACKHTPKCIHNAGRAEGERRVEGEGKQEKSRTCNSKPSDKLNV